MAHAILVLNLLMSGMVQESNAVPRCLKALVERAKSWSTRRTLDESNAHFARVYGKYGGRIIKGDSGGTAVNCHGYAISQNQVAAADWVEEAELKTLLAANFEKVKTLHAEDLRESHRFLEFVPNDVVTFISEAGEHVHTGIIVEREAWDLEPNWIRSKYGPGATFEIPLSKVHFVFPYEFVRVEIWRKKLARPDGFEPPTT